MELKRRKVQRYVIFKIDDRREEIVVEKTGAPGESYDDFHGVATTRRRCRRTTAVACDLLKGFLCRYFFGAGRSIRVDCGPDLAIFEGGRCAEGLRLPWSCCTDAGPSFLIAECWLTSRVESGIQATSWRRVLQCQMQGLGGQARQAKV